MTRDIGLLRTTGARAASVPGCLALFAGWLLLFGLGAPNSSTGYAVAESWLVRDHLATGTPLAGACCAVGYVQEATSAAEREREQLYAERDAWNAFVDDVRAVPAPARQPTGATTAQLATPDAGEDGLCAVRGAYRGTIMSVPHYDDAYGESLRAHMTAEFGDDLAAAIVDGNRFSTSLKGLVVQRARTAARRREEVAAVIDDERDSVIDARSRLRETDARLDRASDAELLHTSFSELVALERDLRREERRCERLLQDRQREIHRGSHGVRRSSRPFPQKYLYADFDVTFPVLATTLERIRWIRDRRRAVCRQLTRRY